MIKNISGAIMKKFLSALLLLFLLPLSACATTLAEKQDEATDEGWVEIQSITYNIGDKNTTLTSTFEWIYDIEEDNVPMEGVPESQKDPFTLSGEISVVKDDFITNAQDYYGKSYYFTQICIMPEQEYYGIKAKISSCLLQYVTIKIEDNSISIRHYVNGELITEKIVPASYQITYFSE